MCSIGPHKPFIPACRRMTKSWTTSWVSSICKTCSSMYGRGKRANALGRCAAPPPLSHGVKGYRRVEGLVTLEDVVEELVGEVHDALEAAQPSIQPLPDGRVLVGGEVRWRGLTNHSG